MLPLLINLEEECASIFSSLNVVPLQMLSYVSWVVLASP
jgi:hypothetical protein